jgi:rhodanese-related sulfurtransferase
VAQAQELIGKGGALVLDVREASEVQQSGKVSGAVHVPRGYSNSSRIPNHLPTTRVSRRADSGGAIDTAQA